VKSFENKSATELQLITKVLSK